MLLLLAEGRRTGGRCLPDFPYPACHFGARLQRVLGGDGLDGKSWEASQGGRWDGGRDAEGLQVDRSCAFPLILKNS